MSALPRPVAVRVAGAGPRRPVVVLTRQRAAMLWALAEHEDGLTVRELGEALGLWSSSSVAHHLAILRTAGLVVGSGHPALSRLGYEVLRLSTCPNCGGHDVEEVPCG